MAEEGDGALPEHALLGVDDEVVVSEDGEELPEMVLVLRRRSGTYQYIVDIDK